MGLPASSPSHPSMCTAYRLQLNEPLPCALHLSQPQLQVLPMLEEEKGEESIFRAAMMWCCHSCLLQVFRGNIRNIRKKQQHHRKKLLLLYSHGWLKQLKYLYILKSRGKIPQDIYYSPSAHQKRSCFYVCSWSRLDGIAKPVLGNHK